MTRILTGLAVLFAALGALILLLPAQAPERPVSGAPALAITGVTVFDGRAFAPEQTIVIEGARITAAGADPAVPQGANIIDGRGLTALPGLIDAHTHTWGDGLQAALRFGVTTHLDMFSAPQMLTEARRSREDPAVRGQADLFSSGMLATVEGGHGTQFGVPVETLSAPEQAADWVAARKAEGSDYIKLVYLPDSPPFESLDMATAAAVIDAAHAEGLMALAHVSSLEGAREMVAAGIDGLVHIFADEPADQGFIEAAREAEIFVIPTLAVVASAAGTGAGGALADDPQVADRLSSAALSGLRGGFGLPPTPMFQYPVAEANVRALHQSGVTILAGSDAPNPGAAYGASLHHELQLLAGAGLTPAEALQAATAGPAEAFSLAGRGRIAPGARADLLLVEGDLREGVGASLSIAAVIRNGAVAAGEPKPETEPRPSALETADIARFDEPTNGFAWIATTDAMAGGSSEAALSVDGGILRAQISVRPGFAFPWAGPGYFPDGPAGAPLDLSAQAALLLRLRGEPGTYRIMLFAPGFAGAPPTVPVTLDEDWRTVRVTLDTLDGFDPSAFAGLAVVGGPQPDEAWLEIAEARFEAHQ